MITGKINVFIDKIKNLAENPELFLANKYQKYRNANGFRIDLYIASNYNAISRKLKWFKVKNLKATTLDSEQKRHKEKGSINYFFFSRHSEKTFCPHCEKTVVPRRLYHLDLADLVITLLTGGLWAIFLFIMYLFRRRCPVCNYNLRGFKFLSDKKRR